MKSPLKTRTEREKLLSDRRIRDHGDCPPCVSGIFISNEPCASLLRLPGGTKSDTCHSDVACAHDSLMSL
jgi:hypothetical protein